MPAHSINRLTLAFLLTLTLCVPAFAEEPSTYVVLGGIPLCGDPEVAQEFLTPEDKGKAKKYQKAWENPKDGPNGTVEVKLPNPDMIPLTIGKDERYPSSVQVYLLDGKIHSVAAWWSTELSDKKSGAPNNKKHFFAAFEELKDKVMVALGEPDSIATPSSRSGLLWSEKKDDEIYVWQAEGRTIKLYTAINRYSGWLIALEATCNETLLESVGENVF